MRVAAFTILLFGTSAVLRGLSPVTLAPERQDIDRAARASSVGDRYSVATIEDWATEVGPDSPLAGYTSLFFTLLHDGQERQVLGAAITGRFFAVFDGVAAEGRLLDVLDDQSNAAPVVVVSHELWQTAFGGRPILGEDLRLNRTFFTVVGIAPPGFSFPEPGTALWTPVAATVPEAVSVTEARFLRVVRSTSY